ncbi:pyridoxal phosphate-dependent decarboxylase family protein [Streptococcus sp. zg-JUN1979]|uniref:pyridoxal phosphate-dependent decarboxylase family protein n=1 Tax=Streptococcus sp. zg-JUN1979 TaxID=3391450 RepID=UPI0039AFEAC3
MENFELLNSENKDYFESELVSLIGSLIDWKTDNSIVRRSNDIHDVIKIDPLPKLGQNLNDSIRYILSTIDRNINFSSNKFMGFPDTGNSLAGLAAAIIEVFLQQNLINKDICSPMGSEIEAEVIIWLRQILGYSFNNRIDDVTKLGGAVTTGGVMSNTYALMAAKRKYPNKRIVILPDNIGHYSLSYATEWLNLGVKVVYCKTENYKINQSALLELLQKHGENILFIGIYACDSMTSTCEDLEGIYTIVNTYSKDIWLHVDACHGFVLEFSDQYKYKVEYLKYFDSCTMDPHKVLWLPYTLSVVLMKNTDDFASLSRSNALIMDDPLSFGKTTPFIGSKSYDSLKLWMVMKTIGIQKIGKMVESRIINAKRFYNILVENSAFFTANTDILFSVIFQYAPKSDMSIDQVNTLNRKIYDKILLEGNYYFHGFGISVDGVNRFVLRYNSGNIDITDVDLKNAVRYIEKIGKEVMYE